MKMKTYITLTTTKKDDIETLDEPLATIMEMIGKLNLAGSPFSLKITNMERRYPGFRRADEKERD